MSSKVKVVKQNDLKDCGVSCLLSIIRYYGGNIPLEKLRIDTKTDKNGTTAFNLVTCAKKYGFDASGYKIDKGKLFDKKIILPCIAHVNIKGYNHFIVIYQITTKYLLVMDPAVGKKKMTTNDFFDIWTGVVIVFYPKGKITFIKPEKTLVQTFINFFKADKKLFFLIFLSNVFFISFTILSSFYFKFGLENLDDYLKIIVICFSIIILLKCTFNYIINYLENYLNKNIDLCLINDFSNHLFNLPSHVIVNRTIGEIVTRVNELNNIKGMFSEIFLSFFLNFLLSLVTIPILYSFNSKLFFILLLSLSLYFVLGLISSKRIYKRVMQNIDLEDEFNNILIENVKCFSTIKNLNVINPALEKMEEKSCQYIYDKFTFSKYLTNIENLKFVISEISLFLINSFGFYYLLKGEMSIANLIVYNSLIIFFTDPIKNLINSLPKYHFLKASFSKLNEFINIEEEKIKKNNIELKNYDLKMCNIKYDYNDFQNIFANYSLQIKENEHIMIYGKSGCGKSTLCKIICGLENIKSGKILIGDNNYKDISLFDIRSYITYVAQNESLYTDTINNNISFYRDINSDAFAKIVKACYVDKIVENKPLRYETVINMDSNNLSGGEIQRIILARACLNSFKILIIDEALSEVDFNLERKIIMNLRKMFFDKTIIYISHKDQRDLFDRVIYLGDSNENNL